MYTGQGKRIGMLYVLHILVMCTQQYFSYSVYEHFLGVLPGASETPFLGLHEIVAYTFHDGRIEDVAYDPSRDDTEEVDDLHIVEFEFEAIVTEVFI